MEREETDVELARKGKKKRKEEEAANIDPPTRWEVEYHIQKTKINKAAGEDNKVAERIKYRGKALVDELIRTMWETEKIAGNGNWGLLVTYIKRT